ncbi:MAG: hypothetical protein ACN6LP_00780 [Candidatus Carsonella ruddii]
MEKFIIKKFLRKIKKKKINLNNIYSFLDKNIKKKKSSKYKSNIFRYVKFT